MAESMRYDLYKEGCLWHYRRLKPIRTDFEGIGKTKQSAMADWRRKFSAIS